LKKTIEEMREDGRRLAFDNGLTKAICDQFAWGYMAGYGDCLVDHAAEIQQSKQGETVH
jgi:hypothetical protein